MRKLVTSLGILGLVLTGGLFHYVGQENPVVNEAVYTSVSALDIFEMENEKRIEEDVAPLRYSEALTEAAQRKAEYMASNGYFAHTSPEGLPFWHWIEMVGYDYLYAGENLAVKFKTSKGVFNAWMNSEGHKDNIFDDGFTETGVGIATGVYKGVETEFVVQLFGKKMPRFDFQRFYEKR